MKTAIKTIAISMVALGVSGIGDTVANANTNQQLKRDLRAAISGLVLETELQIDAIDAILADNDGMSREEERALLQERRVLVTEFRRLKTRRNRVNRWGTGQLNYWAGIFLAPTVSPS